MLVVALFLLLSLPLHATEIIIFGDSWAEPMGPALETVFKNHGHANVIVHTTDFWGLAARLSSADGLEYITEQLELYPDVDIVNLSVGYNDVHCLLVNGVCNVNWKSSLAGTQAESDILDTIVADTEKIVDHIASIRPGVKVLLQSYDFMRPLPDLEIAIKGTPVQNNAVHLKWAERVATLSHRKPTLTFIDLHGLMQVTYGFDGNQYTIYDPKHAIPAGDASLPDSSLPSPYQPFGKYRSHLNKEGFETLAEGHYDGFYGPLLHDPGSQIGAGHSDAWFNPDKLGGQGVFVVVFPDIGHVFLAWFTYDLTLPDAGIDSTIGHPSQRWYTAFGPYNGNIAVLNLELNSGGVFDSAAPFDQVNDGTLTLKATSCEEMLLSYEITSAGIQGEIPLARITDDNLDYCEKLANGGLTKAKRNINSLPFYSDQLSVVTAGTEINAGFSDAWLNPEKMGGQGIFAVVYPVLKSIFMAWFTYNTEQPPGDIDYTIGHPSQRWYTAFGPYDGDTAILNLELNSNGKFDSAAPFEQVIDGEVALKSIDCNEMLLTYDIFSANLHGEIPLKRIANDNASRCTTLEADAK